MRYNTTLAYLYAQLPMFHRIGAAAYKADLSTTIRIAALLGNPEQKFPSVHIAGTNGKGSVSHFTASILQEAGYRTGLFTSPHLKDFRERIRVNGKMISKSDVIHFVNAHKTDFEQLQPSFFEWTFALASWHFAKAEVDIAVMETGMGGRLDSTNICKPVLSVITNIGFDHMQFLGNTLPAIAAEKAGIIKPGVPVVIGESHPETSAVFTEKAARAHTPIFFADRLLQAESFSFTRHVPRRLRVTYRQNADGSLVKLTSPLSGTYQAKNLAMVLAVCRQLQSAGYTISDEHIRKGVARVLANTGFAGRWQTIAKNPLTVADIGHNADGIREVIENIRLTPHDKLHVVIGVVNDKDIAAMLQQLPKDAVYYFCKADIPRGLDARELAGRAASAGLRGNAYASVAQALDAARNTAAAGDMVFVGGSAFVVAEVL